jgi:hypothetical protein
MRRASHDVRTIAAAVAAWAASAPRPARLTGRRTRPTATAALAAALVAAASTAAALAAAPVVTAAVVTATAVVALTAPVADTASAAALPLHDPSVRPHLDRADPDCRVHIADVRVAGDRSHGRLIDTASVGASVACRFTVHHLSLQVTLWKAGLLYDHEQSQTTVRAAVGDRLGNYLTHVTCEDQTISRFYGVAHAVVYFGGRRGDAWVRSTGNRSARCGT